MVRVVLGVALVLLLALPTFGQGMKFTAYAGGGFSMTSSPDMFKEAYKGAAVFGGAVGIEFNPRFEALVNFSTGKHDLDPDGFLEYATGGVSVPDLVVQLEGLDITVLDISAGVKFNLMELKEDIGFRPFLIGLVGYSKATQDAGSAYITYQGQVLMDESSPEIDDTGTSFAFGGGAEYMFTPQVGVWASAMYQTISGEPDNFGFIPIKGGIKLAFGQQP